MPIQAELGDIIENLTAHEVALTMQLGNMSAQAKQLNDQLDQIQSALTALRGGKLNGKPPARNGDASLKRKATPAVIQEIVTNLVAKHDRMPPDELLGQVKSELLARGLSRVGAKSMLADAIKRLRPSIDAKQSPSNRNQGGESL